MASMDCDLAGAEDEVVDGVGLLALSPLVTTRPVMARSRSRLKKKRIVR